MSPEFKHDCVISLMKMGITKLIPKTEYIKETKISNITLKNPIGMAAGFDKNADVVKPLLDMGFGFVEIGTVTPFPQKGNEKPRLFKYNEHKSIVNRMGFNNKGHYYVHNNLNNFRLNDEKSIVGVNIGCNKNSDDMIREYVSGLMEFKDVASYLTLNISSPNTKNLRNLQKGQNFIYLLDEIYTNKHKYNIKIPIFLKLSPDEMQYEYEDIMRVCDNFNVIDGIIIGNTSIDKKIKKQNNIKETGGISGQLIKNKSMKNLSLIKDMTNIPIISCGGIDSVEEINKRLNNGATAIQMYSSLVFNKPWFITQLLKGMKNV